MRTLGWKKRCYWLEVENSGSKIIVEMESGTNIASRLYNLNCYDMIQVTEKDICLAKCLSGRMQGACTGSGLQSQFDRTGFNKG